VQTLYFNLHIVHFITFLKFKSRETTRFSNYKKKKRRRQVYGIDAYKYALLTSHYLKIAPPIFSQFKLNMFLEHQNHFN